MISNLDETFSVAEMEAIQRSAWEKTFRYTATCSPFYREHFRRAGLSPDRPIPLSRITDIPPVDKTVVSEDADAFLCVPRKKVVDIVTTSGSTGRPLVWMLTEADLDRLGHNEELCFHGAGFTAADTVLLAVAMDRCFIAGMAYFLGLRKLGCAIARIGPATTAMHLDMLQRLKASAIVGVPSFLSHIAAKAAESGLDLAACGVRKAVCIGEPVRHQDFTLNPAGAAIERHWQARVFSTYGVTELAGSLCECEAGCGGHLHPDQFYVEVLDEAGLPVPDGQVGEVTATTFGVEAMPLVRYRTGDFAAIHREPCRCGRNTLRVGPIVGRKHHKLKLKGATIFPSTLKVILDSTPGVSAYAVIARRENELSDAVEVKVACSADPASICRALRDRFQGEAKVTPRITPATPAEIESLQMPEGARKRRYFVDLRS